METLGSLASALSKAHAKIKAPIKNRRVNFSDKSGRKVQYSYADLADCIEAVKLPLSENELCVIHQLEFSDKGYGLLTSLLHASGEKITTWYPLPDPSQQSIRAQEFGSALTYARRYSLSSLLGIASEEDDDGQSAASTDNHKFQIQVPVKTQSAPVIQPKVQPEVQPMPKYDEEKTLAPGYDTNIDKIMAFQAMYKLTNDQMRDIIKRTTGKDNSSQCSELELEAAFNYMKMKFRGGTI